MAYRSFPLYNLGASVGKGGANRADDVRLIQALLEHIWGAPNMLKAASTAKQFKVAAPQKPYSVTGVYTDDLAAWILLLQNEGKRTANLNCVCDGRIDPLPLERNTLDYASETKSGKDYFLLILVRTAIKKDARGYLEMAGRLGLPFQMTGSTAELNV